MLKLTDVHCHIIPGVDDGAKDLETARCMLRREYRDGVRRIIVTPHYRRNMFETPMETIRKQFGRLQAVAKEVGEDLQIELGCEYHTHGEMAKCLAAGERPAMAGSRYILVEFSSRHSFRVIWNQICSLQLEGFQPIIAHIERYPCLVENLDYVRQLSDQGVMIQVNAGSILGEEGFSIKWYCRKLMKADLIDLIGSDAHDLKERKPNLGACAAYVEKKMGRKYARKIFVINPGRIRAD